MFRRSRDEQSGGLGSPGDAVATVVVCGFNATTTTTAAASIIAAVAASAGAPGANRRLLLFELRLWSALSSSSDSSAWFTLLLLSASQHLDFWWPGALAKKLTNENPPGFTTGSSWLPLVLDSKYTYKYKRLGTSCKIFTCNLLS